MPPDNSSQILLAAVEDSLSSLGDSPKQAILFRLESSFEIKKEHFWADLPKHAKPLEGIFGHEASCLEKLIVKRLCEKLGLDFDGAECLDFLKCVIICKST